MRRLKPIRFCTGDYLQNRPKKLLFLLILMLGFGVGCASDGDQKPGGGSKAYEKFQEGLRYGSVNLKTEQINSLKEAVALEPEEMTYRYFLAVAYFNNGDIDESEKEFKRIIETDKGYKDAYRQLGRLKMEKAQWQEAIYYFEEELKLPGTAAPHQIYNWLALSYYNSGNFPKAEEEWKRALNIGENPAIRLNLALAYKENERFAEAQDSLNKAIALRPKFPQARYELGLLLLKEKKVEEAIGHFEAAARMAPKSRWGRASIEYLNLLRPQD